MEIIHINVCGHFDTPSIGKEKYLITFIDDFSCYRYVYLLKEKSQVVDAFKIYIDKVERKLRRK